jgi:hypothetical protein
MELSVYPFSAQNATTTWYRGVHYGKIGAMREIQKEAGGLLACAARAMIKSASVVSQTNGDL